MKKSNPDSSMIGDLLKKLHASYFGDKKTEEKAERKKKTDEEDTKLLDQLKATLSRVTNPKAKSSKPKKQATSKAKSSTPAPKAEERVADPIEEITAEPIKEITAEPIEEITTEQADEEASIPSPAALLAEELAPKRQKKSKKSVAKKQADKAPIEPTEPTDEPATEEAPQATEEIVAAPIAEEIPVAAEVLAPIEEPEVTEISPAEEAESEEEPLLPPTDDAEEELLFDSDEDAPEEEYASTPHLRKKVIIKKKIKKRAAEAPAEPSDGKKTVKREAPGVTVPKNADTNQFTKDKFTEEEPAIVIRPAGAPQKPTNEPIVIRPRTQEYQPPRPTVSRETPPAPSVTNDTMQKKEDVTKEPVRVLPQEPETVESLPAVEELPAEELPTAEVSEAPVAEPTPDAEPTPAPAPARVTKKRIARVRNTPVTTLPEDEGLHEELEDMAEEMLDAPMPELIPEEEPEAGDVAQPQKISAFQRRRMKKNEENNLSVSEIIQNRSGLSDDDIAMMFELGYENELGRRVGYETMKKLHYEHLRRSSHSTQTHYRTAFGYRGNEYVGSKQNEGVLAAYAHDKRTLIHRLVLTAFLSLLLFFIDMPLLVGGSVAEWAVQKPLLFPLLGIAGLLLTSLLSARQIYAGARSLMRFTPTPYSIVAATLPLALAYDILSLVLAKGMLPINFTVALLLLLITVFDTLRLASELRAFRILSASTEKLVLEPSTPRKKKMRQGDKIVKVINDSIDENHLRVRTADQTTGFFRRFNNMESFSRPIITLLCLVGPAAFLFSFAVAVRTHSIASAAEALISAWLIGAPSMLIVDCVYPLFCANNRLARRNCTLVGEEAVEEYADELTVIFNDTDLYRTEKCSGISVREGDDFRKDIKLTEILLRKMGGTLAKIGGGECKPSDPPVAFVRITENGVEAVVDNQFYLLLGNAEFLRRSGVRVPKESTDQFLRRPPHTSLMYVAIDGTLKLSYEIEYRNNTDFEDTVTLLSMAGNLVAISSHDPNLTENFLLNSRRGCEDPIGVIRPSRYDADNTLEVADTGMVALAARDTVALPLYAAKMIKSTRRRGFWLQLAATALGISLVATLTLIGEASLISPVGIALYQVASIAIGAIHTRTSLSSNKLYT